MSSAKQPLLAALATVLLWAFAFPASKAALPYFSAEQIVLLRYAVACGFYLALFAAGRFAWPQLRDLPLIFILGVLGVTVYQLLFVHGIGRVTAGAAAMIIAAIPVFAGLLARFFLREKLSRPAWCGIAISLAGVALIAVEKDIAGEFSGAILLIMATVSVSIYFVFQKPFFSRYSPLSLTAWTSLAGTLPLLYQLPAAVDAALQAPAVALWSVAAMGVRGRWLQVRKRWLQRPEWWFDMRKWWFQRKNCPRFFGGKRQHRARRCYTGRHHPPNEANHDHSQRTRSGD